MEILIAAVVLAVGLVAAASLLARRSPGFAGRASAPPPAPAARPAAVPAPSPAGPTVTTTEDGKSAERRADLLRLEERLRAREEAVESRLSELGERERVLVAKATDLDGALQDQLRKLERVAGMSASQARQQLLKDVEDQTRHE